MGIRGRTLSVTAVLICAVTLSGCSGADGSAPIASPSPTPTPSALAFVMPAMPGPLLDLSCPGLVPAADLRALFGAKDYQPRTDTAWLVSPREYAVQGAGGIACLWGNDAPERKGGGFANAASDLLQVTVLPGVTVAEWAKHGDPYPQDDLAAAFGDRSRTGCFAGNDPAPACSVNVLVGNVWLEVLAYGINIAAGGVDADLLAQVSPVVDGMVDRIRAAAVIGRQAPPADPALCRSVLPGDWTRPAVGWSLAGSAAERAGAVTCLPRKAGAKGVAAAWLELLPGGAWAFAPVGAEAGVAVHAEVVTVAGTSVPSSYLRCPVPGSPSDTESFSGCSVDLAVGDDWLRVGLPIDDRNLWYPGMAGHLLGLAAEVVQHAGK